MAVKKPFASDSVTDPRASCCFLPERLLTSLVTIVNLIAVTTTETGLRVRAEIDKGKYPQGREVSDEEMALIRLRPSRFYGDWNYTVQPSSS